MHLTRVTVGSVGLSVLLLLAPKQSNGDKDQQRTVTLTIPCETTFTAINASPGVQAPEDIYVCKDQKVRWYANKHTIKVTFKKKSPFKNGQMVFTASGDGYAESDEMGDFAHIQGFPFKIEVDGVPYDPQIIGGGH